MHLCIQYSVQVIVQYKLAMLPWLLLWWWVVQLSVLHQKVMAVNEVVLWGEGRGGVGWGRGRRDTERKRGGGGAIKRGGPFQ